MTAPTPSTAAAAFITDDTQLTLATAKAFVSEGMISPENVAAEMVAAYRRGLRGAGSSTLHALEHLSAGAHWALSGRTGEMAAGNGVAMRMAPLAFVLDPAVQSDRVVMRDIARITHKSEEAYVGGLAVIFAIRLALSGALDSPSYEFLATLADELPDSRVRDVMRLRNLERCTSVAELARFTGTSGFVAESVPFALAAVALFGSRGFESLLREIIVEGGDCDTNASIAGQVLGAGVGIDSIPSDLRLWIGEVPGIEQTVESFLDALGVSNRPTSTSLLRFDEPK